ncbi:MAG: hypothetical protein IT318_26460 [Anaerolineales bacterium]|nr:hypothetical protein [Anaerolineales bacterium]
MADADRLKRRLAPQGAAGPSSARRMIGWVSRLGLLCLLALMAALAVEVWLPFRPSPHAVAAYLTHSLRWDPRLGLPGPNPAQLRLLQPLDHWQIALTTNQQSDGTPCFTIGFVTARWLTGPGTQFSGGKCYSLEFADSSIQLISLREHGYVAGGVITSPAIAHLRATWLDGSGTDLSAENGAFLVVRPDGVGLLSVVGLNAAGDIVDRSQTYDEHRGFALVDAYAVREVISAHGLILLSAYTQRVPATQECVRLSYGIGENVARAMAGETYLSEQMLCTDGVDQPVGPAASAIFDSATFAGGRVFDPAITAVVVVWSDGQQQTAPVVEGFYFAERESTTATVAVVTGVGSSPGND